MYFFKMNCVLLFVIFEVLSSVHAASVVGNCPPGELVKYKVTFNTTWDRKDFPKQYPDTRPPAQWSKMIGVSHNHEVELYEPGQLATEALKAFAQTGNSEQLDLLTQGESGVLDSFRTAPIYQGVGESFSEFYVDGNHSRVSLVSKIVPSPDWFVGVNGYDLCAGGHWVDTVNVQLEPLDAGTDKGLTFTSPNWPSNPPEKIHTITAQYPDHPAGSFYYSDLDHLPCIARVSFVKQKEYDLRRQFDVDTSLNDVYNIEEINLKKHGGESKDTKNEVPYITGDKRIRISSHVSDNDVLPKGNNHPRLPNQRHHSKRKYNTPSHGVTEPGIHDVHSQNMISSNSVVADEHIITTNSNKKIPANDAMAVIDDIVKTYQKDRKRKLKKKRREEKQRRRNEMKKIRPPRDCRVSDWSEWSSCSKTCGIGEQSRTRTILKHARRGGQVCPSLRETAWCGSARDCNRQYFIWS